MATMKPKKTTDKMPKPPRGEIKVSPSVKVIPGKMGQSVRASFVNDKLASGADKARAENARSMVKSAAAKKALKNVNDTKKSAAAKAAKVEKKALKVANKPTKGKADITKGELAKLRASGVTAKSTMKKVPNRGGIFGGRRPRGGGSAGGLGINDMNR